MGSADRVYKQCKKMQQGVGEKGTRDNRGVGDSRGYEPGGRGYELNTFF